MNPLHKILDSILVQEASIPSFHLVIWGCTLDELCKIAALARQQLNEKESQKNPNPNDICAPSS